MTDTDTTTVDAPDVDAPDVEADTSTPDLSAAVEADRDRDEPADAADSAPARSATPSRSRSTSTRDRKPRKRTTTRKASASKATGSKSSKSKSLERPLREMLLAVGAGVSLLEPVDGAVITHRANELAKALDAAAANNPRLYDTLSGLVNGAGWGQVVMTLGLIVVPIAWHHGAIPDSPIVRMAVPREVQKMHDERNANGGADVADLFGGLGSLLAVPDTAGA